MRNVCEYVSPSTLQKYTFEAGETVKINTKPNAESVEITFDGINGEEAKTDEYDIFPLTIDAVEVGTYTITQRLANGKVRTDKFYVRAPYKESDYSFVGEYLAPETYDGAQVGSDNAHFNILEILPYLLALCLLLVAVEWGLQYHEQF